MKEEDCRLCQYYSQQRCTHVADFSIAGLMGTRPRPQPQHPAHPQPLPPFWATNDALLLSAYFFKLGYYQPAGPLISAGPLHGGFKGDGGSGGAPPPTGPPQDPAYSRYQYPQPQQVMHYGGGFSSPHSAYGSAYSGGPGGGAGRLPTMGAPPPPPPPACYRAPPAHRPPLTYRAAPPPPDNQVSPAGPEAYAPQYCTPCYQHPHVPPRAAIAYLDSSYQGCPCPMSTCPKNVHTGPATGNPPVSSGPSQSSSSGGTRTSQESTQGGCCVVAVNPSLGLVPPEALGPPSPARGSAGLDPPHPPRRARLGKAMARKSIAPEESDNTLLLMCHPTPPPLTVNTDSTTPKVESVKNEEDSGDDVILLDSPSSKMAPIDLSSSEENGADSKSEKDCEIVRREENVRLEDNSRHEDTSRREDVRREENVRREEIVRIEDSDPSVINLSVEMKKENLEIYNENQQSRKISPSNTEVQALKEHNVDNSNAVNVDNLKKTNDTKPKTGTKRRCSKLEIDMEVDLDDSLAANGIGEHVKLQKRQKVSMADAQVTKKNGTMGSYKDLIKKNDKVFKLNNGKRQLNTVKPKTLNKTISLIDCDKSLTKKVAQKRKSVSPIIGETPASKRKKFTTHILKLADKKRNSRLSEEEPVVEKLRECPKKTIMSVPKSKSATLLDDLMMKNNIERVIESVVKNASTEAEPASQANPGSLLCSTPKASTKSTSVCTLKPKKCSGLSTDAGAVKNRTVLNINNNVVKKVSESECGLVPPEKVERKLSTEKRGRTKSKSPAAINRVSEKKQKDVKAKCQNDTDVAKDATSTAKVESTKGKKGKNQSTAGGKGAQGKKKAKSIEPEKVEEILDLPLVHGAPRWSNGWAWEGEPQFSKVYINNEENCLWARSWSGMRHDMAGDSVRRGDSVLLRAGTRRSEPPFVARVSQLWENPSDGEMMVSLLWYYRPEHTERGRQSEDCFDEVFASRHRDVNSVACIEDKCYVLTYNEYCRYRKQLRATEENVRCPPSIVPSMPANEVVPSIATNDAKIPVNVSPELVLFCRRVYDFRLKKVMK